MNFQFTVVSRKYGAFVVTAPLRFKAEIERYKWHVNKSKNRASGREFDVKTSVTAATSIYLHRFIWDLAGRPPVRAIDHIDGQPLNNSEDNLRDGTRGNSQHRHLQCNNTSGTKGVYEFKQNGKWHARIKVNGKRIHLGYFADQAEAHITYDIAALKFHGEFAVLNKPANDNITPEEYRALIEEMAA